MSVLRVYDPAECDADGVPLGWERCPACKDGFLVGKGSFEGVRGPACGRCGGHGSLKAAALAEARFRGWSSADHINYDRGDDVPARCEGCGHPRSDGTYNYTLRDDTDVGMTFENALWLMDHYHGQAGQYQHRVDPYVKLAAGQTPDWIGEHWSACDEGCRHDGGPGRVWADADIHGPRWHHHEDFDRVCREDLRENGHGSGEALWRPVDIWLSGWPHDLRPEKLMLLCLRCLAERITT